MVRISGEIAVSRLYPSRLIQKEEMVYELLRGGRNVCVWSLRLKMTTTRAEM